MLSECYWLHTGRGKHLAAMRLGEPAARTLCELRELVRFLIWPGFGGGVPPGPLNKYHLSGQFYLLFGVCFPIDLNLH